EAVTQEDALRGVLERICSTTGWPAGRAYMAAGHSLWHVAEPSFARRLQPIARQRTGIHIGSEDRWAAGTVGGLWSFAIPLQRGPRAVQLEFFSEPGEEPEEAALEALAQACAPLAAILRRKPSE